MKYEVDAKNKSFGRLASEVALLLRGKRMVSFTPNKLPGVEVVVNNLNKTKFTGNKYDSKIYYRYSGYHSGIRARKLSELWQSRPEYVFRHSVYRMLPKNKMRDKIIKNLKFK